MKGNIMESNLKEWVWLSSIPGIGAVKSGNFWSILGIYIMLECHCG